MGWARVPKTVVRDVDIPLVHQSGLTSVVVLPVTVALDAEELPLIEFVLLTVSLGALHGKPVVTFDPAKHVVDRLKSFGSVEGTWRVTSFFFANYSCSAQRLVDLLNRPLVLFVTLSVLLGVPGVDFLARYVGLGIDQAIICLRSDVCDQFVSPLISTWI